ncbi:MAG: polysaccharide biosynthesis tyrosine autokinase [Chitinophagaceae bacterium]|nr:polysaccharide biosynthesis tyrosine autokinase [Chitinophagaceae bacterium]
MQQGELMQDNYKRHNEGNVLQNLFGKYLPWWPLFAGLFLLGLAGSWLYIRYAKSLYESSASLLLKDDKKGLDDSNIMESLNFFGSKKIVENEIEVIKSRSIAKEVAKKLRLYAPIRKKGRIKDISAYTFSPVIVEALNVDSIKSSHDEKIYFSVDSIEAGIKVNDRIYCIGDWMETPFGIVRFQPNPYYNVPEKDEEDKDDKPLFYFTISSIKATANALLDGIGVSASSKQSTVINLTYRDEVSKRADNILNEFIAAYNRAAVNDKNVLAANTLAFVEDRLRFVVNDLDSVEQRLERFKTHNRIVDISEQGRQFLQNVSLNDQKVEEMNMQMSVLNQVEEYVLSKNKSGAIVPSTVGVADPVLSKLLDQLYELETQYEKLKATTAENSPLLMSVTEQLRNIRPNILENIKNQKRNLEAGKNNLIGTVNNYSTMLQRLPSTERKLLDISRQQSIKNSIYTFLLQKREETMLSYASAVADSRIIDIGESTDKPVSPRKIIVLAVAMALAMGVGIGFVEIKDLMNRNVLAKTEIERYTQIPIIGEVSLDKSGNPLVIAEGKRSFIAEQFRQLRTSLGYLGINSRRKKILVTSSISGEGKSFICANLGISLALIDKKVVLIELDLRKPKLSQLFNIPRHSGISNYLISEKEAEDIIKSTGTSNLFIIPSGPVPPNPSELILNGRLQELLQYLEKHFDYIIIDTAPVNPVTDAHIISPMCDATLFVIRQGYTPRVHLQRLDEQSRLQGLKNAAIVFNGIKASKFSSYGYGYGYTEDEPANKVKKKIKFEI